MTSSDVIETLESIRVAVEEGRKQEATDLLTGLGEQYGDVRTEESARRNRFLQAHNEGGVTEADRATLTEYVSKATKIQAQRSELLIQGSRYVSDLEIDLDTLVATANETVAAERALLDARRVAENVDVPGSLPASVAVFGVDVPVEVLPKGGTDDLEIIVGNVGDDKAEDVQLTVSASDEVTVEDDTIDLSGFTDRVVRDVTLEGVSPGQGSIEVELTSANAGSDFDTESVRVVGKRDAIETAKIHLENARQRLNTSRQDRSRGQSIDSKVSNADEKLDDALRFVERDQEEQANNMLNAASRILGAVLNQLAGSGESVDEAFYVEQQVIAATDAIGRAREATL